jgi:hypothetical protein
MPEVSRFYGIRICLYFDDHGIPHFHAEHGGSDVSVAIHNLEFLKGELPRTVKKLVIQWASLHQDELGYALFQCRRSEDPGRIPPLE